mmetsp:Transcript_51241/g.141826  ORF Transcript_51241/g.141826 Transcript_51241/m.141826 type:complete len:205 (-) Transcript_51241:920-1534(-)
MRPASLGTCSGASSANSAARMGSNRWARGSSGWKMLRSRVGGGSVKDGESCVSAARCSQAPSGEPSKQSTFGPKVKRRVRASSKSTAPPRPCPTSTTVPSKSGRYCRKLAMAASTASRVADWIAARHSGCEYSNVSMTTLFARALICGIAGRPMRLRPSARPRALCDQETSITSSLRTLGGSGPSPTNSQDSPSGCCTKPPKRN